MHYSVDCRVCGEHIDVTDYDPRNLNVLCGSCEAEALVPWDEDEETPWDSLPPWSHEEVAPWKVTPPTDDDAPF